MPTSKRNQNARKKGFYSPLYRTDETSLLTDDQSASLEHEINLLRVMIKRTMEMADGIDDLREATRILDALSAATTRLANLLRAQKSLNEAQSKSADLLSIAIKEVNEELRRKNG